MNSFGEARLHAESPGEIPRESKAKWRQEMKRRRALMTGPERAAASRAMVDHLVNWVTQIWLPEHAGEAVGVYLAGPREPDLDPLIVRLLAMGVPLAAPRVDVERATMAFWPLTNLSQVESGPWGVRQPSATGTPVPVGLALVPGLAFDAEGARLGTGGGWYDRVLPGIPLAAGICFDFQRVEFLPRERHDCSVQLLFTEKQHWDFVS